MVSTLVLLPLLAGIAAAQLPVPGSIPGVGDLAAQQAWILAQQAHINMQHQFTQVQLQSLVAAGRKRRSLPLPGTEAVAALTNNPTAQAYWYQAQLQHQQNIINQKALELGAAGGRKRRSVPLPGTEAVAALTNNPTAQAYWYQAQLQHQQNIINQKALELGAAGGRKRRSLPLPGTEAVAALTHNPAASAYWYQAQLQHQQNIINQRALELGAAGGRKKRSAQLPVPGTLPGVGDIAAQQAWILAQQAHINMQHQFTQLQLQSLVGRKRRSVPLPGTEAVAALTYNLPAQAYWYQAQLQHQQNIINQKALELGAAGGK